jgi:hypothetical protein
MSLLAPADVAARWHCNKEHVVVLLRRGDLRGVKLANKWRIELDDVVAYEKSQENRPVARRRRRRSA